VTHEMRIGGVAVKTDAAFGPPPLPELRFHWMELSAPRAPEQVGSLRHDDEPHATFEP